MLLDSVIFVKISSVKIQKEFQRKMYIVHKEIGNVFFLFISIHIAAAVVASRDSEEGKGGVPKRKNSDPAARQKKKAKATPDGRKNCNKLHHRNI